MIVLLNSFARSKRNPEQDGDAAGFFSLIAAPPLADQATLNEDRPLHHL